MRFGMKTRVGPRNDALQGGDPPEEWGNFDTVSVLRPRSCSRRYSCPPRSTTPRSFAETNDCQTEEKSTTNSGDRHPDESEDISTLLSAVEDLLHDLLVRSVFSVSELRSSENLSLGVRNVK